MFDILADAIGVLLGWGLGLLLKKLVSVSAAARY
jgi:hypothetical protein